MSKELVSGKRELDERTGSRFFVIVVSALFISGGFSVLLFMDASAVEPTSKSPTFVNPKSIIIPETFDAYSNFTHFYDPGPPVDDIDFTSGRIYIVAMGGIACSGTYDVAAVDLHPSELSTYVVSVNNYNPYGPPFNLGGGLYDIYFSVADTLGLRGCSGPGSLSITAPDSTPPLVAGHGHGGPPGFTGTPVFTVNPTTTTTELEYQVNDMDTGNSLITDSEYFYCGPSPTPCGPDPSWVNDTGNKPDLPLPEDPWGGFPPPPQIWDNRSRMFLRNALDVSLWPEGKYWFYIHGADCGEDQICQGGLGDDNWGKNVGSVGNNFYELMLFVGIPNDPPLLEWTGDSGYVTDGVDPDSGPAGSSFTYKVKYSDINNHSMPGPGSIITFIHKPCGTPIAGNPFLMDFERWVGTPNDWTQGAIYNMTTTLSEGSNIYAYYFYANDGYDAATGAPTVPCTAGPVVSTIGNAAPTLSWTGEPGYTADGVNPDSGTTITTFEYRVNYSDADNDPPLAGYPKLHIEKPCGTPWNTYSMTAANPGDTDYTDGKIYNYSIVLATVGSDFAHYFNATDGKDWASGPPSVPCTAGPTVTLFVNSAPVLDWTGEPGYVSDGVNPDTGTSATTFQYRIKYSDVDNETPAAGTPKVYIQKPCGVNWGLSPYSMIFDLWVGATNDYAAGAIYFMQTPLTPDGTNYAYYFNASDGGRYATSAPTVPCTDGPDVGSVTPPPAAPAGLWVERSSPNIVVHWNASSGANSYNVYRSNNRFAAFPSGWTQVTGVAGTQWTHSGAYGDSLTWFYIVRANNATAGESANSTMGVKLHKAFGTPSSNPSRNVYWISLPYVSKFKKASDIVIDLEGSLFTPPTKINMLCKWNPASQNSVSFSYSKGRWRGTDFAISAGDGICLNSKNAAWSWVINGTDSNTQLSFTFNAPPKKNINWLSLPYTNSYTTASAIVLDIEGSLATAPTKIKAIGWWNATTQSSVVYQWTGSAWTGTNFAIMPGEGYYFDILSTFNWTPDLITPPVP